MRKSNVAVAAISLATLAALSLDRQVTIISQAQADDQAPCARGEAILRGTYMSMGGGTVIGVGPIAFIGTLYFDGNGGGTNPFTRSLNGVITRADAPVTYTVNSDCTGTLTLAGRIHLDIRISPNGAKVDYIETDAGTVSSGSASRVND